MFKYSLTLLTCVIGLLAFAAGANADQRSANDHDKSVHCLPEQNTVISKTGVQTVASSRCFRGSITLSVSGQSNPWDQTINPTLIYSAPGDAFAPVVVQLATYKIKHHDYIALTCTGGTTNAGGLPNTGCGGLAGFGFPPSNNTYQPACGTYYPSFYADPSTYPIYVFQVMGVFATSAGVVVGKPFPLSPQTVYVAVPNGAELLQLGMNDCLNSDNSAAPLTVKLTY